ATDGGATALALNVAVDVLAGTYQVYVNASSLTDGQSAHETTFTLNVSSEVVTALLVDNDASENNADGGGSPSVSDTLFPQLLQSAGIVFNTYVIPSLASDQFSILTVQQ